MKFISLNPEQLSELDAMMQSKACDKRTFKRLQSVKLNAKGYSIPQISGSAGCALDNSVYNWITQYEKEGVSTGLKDHPSFSGRPTHLNRMQIPLQLVDEIDID